ncbi:ribonuclease P protein component [Mycoplasma sp. 4079]|uniref:ribonuclease P protein component n=1 Tax=Mycoplasma sp. 4079 TaxID=3398615 RepID=UPI0039FDDDB7
MKKQYRLKKNWEFEDVINARQGNFVSNRYLIIYFKRRKNFAAGITVPKKFAKAVGRNFFKRQLRAIMHELNLYHLKYHFVLIVRKEFMKEDFAIKKQHIAKLFEKFK